MVNTVAAAIQISGDATQAPVAGAEQGIQALIRLQAVTASLDAAATRAEVGRVLMEQGVGLLDAASGSISIATGRGELEVLDAFGDPDRAPVARRSHARDLPAPLAEAFRTGRAVWLASAAEHAARYPHASPPIAGASVAVPLVTGGRVIGVLATDFDAPRTWDEPDRSFILAVANQAAVALERARLYEAERALRVRAEHAAALLDTMFSSVPIGLAFVDRDLRFVHVNAAWARLHDRVPGECVGRTVAEVLGGPASAARVLRWRRALSCGEPTGDAEYSRPDADDGAGPRTWLEGCYPVAAGGEVVGLAAVARDVTSARRAEEFRSRLLGIVGHDLRNPLNAIVGFAHVLRNAGPLDERQLRAVERLEHSARKAARIAHDLLDLARIESTGGMPIEAAPGRVDEICAAVATEAETAFPGREVRVTGRGDSIVRWDAQRVSQALSNLVANGLKHGAPDGPVTVAWEATGDTVSMRVHNRGPPIPPELRDHLFEPFRQGEQKDARASGVGLGLYIASEIARAHGGSMEVSSGDRDGTVFTLTLPRR